jgi:hypothetical protein
MDIGDIELKFEGIELKFEDIVGIVNTINEDIGDQITQENKCIQCAMIPPKLKYMCIKYYKRVFKPNGGNNINDLTFKTDNKSFIGKYETFIKQEFFDNINLKNFEFSMQERTQTKTTTGNTKHLFIKNQEHREFVSKKEAESMKLIEKHKNTITTNTHFILYYPILENCKSDCGAEVVYYNKYNERKTVILPADDNVVYCIRDCCFIHKTPDSEFIDENEPITRVIIRTYVTPEGGEFENMLCPLLSKGLPWGDETKGCVETVEKNGGKKRNKSRKNGRVRFYKKKTITRRIKKLRKGK